MMEKVCDNKSVGVIIVNDRDELALLRRGRFPVGMAPPAGHVDDHGSIEQSAIDEVSEELGVSLAIEGLIQTIIQNRNVSNVCRRMNGNYHVWTVYEAKIMQTELLPDTDETLGADWYSRSAVQALADRTKAYNRKEINEQEWISRPGLEPVWLDFLQELDYVS